MHPLNEQAVGFSVPTPRALETVLARIEALSQKPEFAMQRQLGLTRALKPPVCRTTLAECSRLFLRKPSWQLFGSSVIFILKTVN